MKKTEWSNFWETQGHSFHDVMKIATNYFAQQIVKRFLQTSSSSILDYGCGPGFLADCIASKNIQISGVDINPGFIEECKRKHPGSKYILATYNTEVNKKIFIDHFGNEKFNIITILSITQYFKDVNDLENLIVLLKPRLADEGIIIIADVIDENTSSVRDAISLFVQCIKHRKLTAFFKFIFYVLFSNYSHVSKKTNLLKISEQTVKHFSESHRLSCQKTDGLTIHSSRTNYVLSNKV